MDADDEFGDLYTDVLVSSDVVVLPPHASPSPSPNPNFVATSVAYLQGDAPSDGDWDSEDDLQIVLNVQTDHIGINLEGHQGLESGDEDEDDLVIVVGDGEQILPQVIEEHEIGDESAQLPSKSERKEGAEAAKVIGIGHGAARGKVGYNNHGHFPHHSQFKALLHFIYWDSLPDVQELAAVESKCASTLMAQHLLVAAYRYGMERLRALCEVKLCEGVSIETVATTLALGEQHNCVQLKSCFSPIHCNAFKSEQFVPELFLQG